MVHASIKSRFPLTAQVFLAALLGVAFGALFDIPIWKELSQFGKLLIHWVKVIAGPFLFFTIVSSILAADISWKHGRRVLVVAMVNLSIAILIGFSLARVFLMEKMEFISQVDGGAKATPAAELSIAAWIKTISPSSIFEPFVKNDILLIALLALIFGIALRSSLKLDLQRLEKGVALFEFMREVMHKVLGWLIHLIPIAVFTLIAGAVSEHGLGILLVLSKYIAVVWLGFFLQCIFVYGAWIKFYARLDIRAFLRAAWPPLSHALGVNSSLATLPLTMKALDSLGVSRRSSSIGAGLATNLNNDGIILYEAMAVFFIAEMHGISLGPMEMFTVALTCIVAALGITGIPAAGFISLSVVITTLGYPAEMLPLLLAVDWIVARGRSAVNVMSDLTLSIAIDAKD